MRAKMMNEDKTEQKKDKKKTKDDRGWSKERKRDKTKCKISYWDENIDR